MGNDGGSIPTRRELVKEAARNRTTAEIKESRQEQQEYNWTTCPLSHGSLVQPVVSDCVGRLYNKDAILKFLLPSEDGTSKTDSEEFLAGRVRSLKDVVEVKFEVEEQAQMEAGSGARHRKEKWVCPVARKELGASVRSAYLSPCGHVFSETAIKEISEEICQQCNQPFSPDHVIPILPTASSELERLNARIKTLKEMCLTHSLKKASGASKRKRKNGNPAAAENGEEEHQASPTISNQVLAPKPSNGIITPSSMIRNPATASLTARVMEDEAEREKRRKLGLNENLKALFTSGAGSSKRDRNGDFMTRGYTIPADAKR